MNDRTMIKVRCDKELLYIRTISWQKKSPHRFAILRSELQKLEQEPNKRVLTSDCGSFASLRLTKGPDGTQILEQHFQWRGTEKIVLYDDSQPYSFFFEEYTPYGRGICGAVILHGIEDIAKARYSVHT